MARCEIFLRIITKAMKPKNHVYLTVQAELFGILEMWQLIFAPPQEMPGKLAACIDALIFLRNTMFYNVVTGV